MVPRRSRRPGLVLLCTRRFGGKTFPFGRFQVKRCCVQASSILINSRKGREKRDNPKARHPPGSDGTQLMKRSQAAKYARWSAAAALVCAGLTLVVYLKRGWTRYNETKNAPPAPAVNVERQSTKLTFSKGEGARTVFTVEAMKSTDFKGLNASDLEGVKVTIFGKEGARHDTLDTHACRYSKDSGDIDCSGDVEIRLMSKLEWEAAKEQAVGSAGAAMKVETRGVVFNRASGEARTEQEVRFTFANGGGQAVGATYHSEEGTLTLLKDVKL